jgi:hypothetical protein
VEFLIPLCGPTAVMTMATVGIFVKSLALFHDRHADYTILDRKEDDCVEALSGQVPDLAHALAYPQACEGTTWYEETVVLEAIIAHCGSALAPVFALEASWAVHAASTYSRLRLMLAVPGTLVLVLLLYGVGLAVFGLIFRAWFIREQGRV